MKRNALGWWVATRPADVAIVAQANAIERARRIEAGESVEGFGLKALPEKKTGSNRTRRRPTTGRVGRTRAGNEWTEAGFFGWLRSGFRRMSLRWPPIVRQALERARRKYVGPNTKQKWEYCCAECSGWFMRKSVAVDHVVAVGSLRSFDDVRGFVERLFVEADGLRVVCVACHELRTQRDRLNTATTTEAAEVVEPVEVEPENMPF